MLRISKISFPGLGIGEFSVNSVAFKIGDIEIAWYALLITFGMVCAVAYTIHKARKIGVTSSDILDIALWTIPAGIIGARLYYVLTKLDEFSSIGEFFNIRGGGLAIYGGIIGGAIAVFICCYVKKINFFAIGDCCTPGIILAQAIGRWGNFINGEAFGYETDVFIRMGLQNTLTGGRLQYVHPTFLYESIWNIIGFVLVNLFYRKKQYDGQIILMVFGWYGLGRMFIEGLRTDSLYTTIFSWTFRTSQVLAAVIFTACAALLIYFIFKKPQRELYFKPAKPAAEEAEVKTESNDNKNENE